jgi:UDP-N-acetylglucosamine--N-acetylmuramyl-(pentapeptide) pyrophosphoryl-undecaprenol N-acetylglucosamine transferase
MRIMIAGGGTGGHLFPALALAEAFQARDPGNAILFVGGRRELEEKILSRAGYARKTIAAAGWKGSSWRAKGKGLLAIPRSFWQSWKAIREFRPDVVLGVGGYASGPVVLAAWCLRMRTAIHEQNAFPGLSNRILGRFVERAFLSFPASARFFPPGKGVLTGNPVRKNIRRRQRAASPIGERRFTLLVFGGSQGAHRLNRAVIDGLKNLRDLRERWRIIHQTGERDREEVAQAYRQEGFEGEVHAFIQDMDRAYGAADLILCRAGATTLFELMAAGKPAILVPYPHAANHHQKLNAQALVETGAALMVLDEDLNGNSLSALVRELADDPERRRQIAARAAAMARPEAAERIVDACYAMVKREHE